MDVLLLCLLDVGCNLVLALFLFFLILHILLVDKLKCRNKSRNEKEYTEYDHILSLFGLLGLLRGLLSPRHLPQLLFEVVAELFVSSHEFPDAETLPVRQVLVLYYGSSQQSLC